MVWQKPVRNPCIFCNIREGVIDTADGPVCQSCMPIELLDDAINIQKHKIIIYKKTHPNWKTCESIIVENRPETLIQERSMVITNNEETPFVDELNYQISRSKKIDIVVSFILLSGLELIYSKLREFTTNNGKLRIITTSYMGATEIEAIRMLLKLNNTEVRMELESGETRLHAKTFIFDDGEKSIAFIGSANISKSALTTGEEWIVKIREDDVPEVIQDAKKGFESLWNSIHFKKITSNNISNVEMILERKKK